ncbi:MAG: hypothetical protein AVDCRST_MAG54-1742 [uncultured Actinomycetospora sp.]|uniref:Uncharacterized protein n=1 Tax=uncultured Actinomycetospora sp. TaxID=1135996 RepID=A0A6J4IBI1_9PSEU|nr:MAG: hypothetical protein AVDCRST_MAG54-1742 [uncultured Actinomycetospora sp.]
MTRILRLVARVAALGAQVPAEHLELLRDQDGFEANGPAQVLARYASYADLLGQAVDAQG